MPPDECICTLPKRAKDVEKGIHALLSGLDRVPEVPVRQWVLALPERLRYFVHRDAELAGRVLNVWLRALESRLRRCSPGAPAYARLGAVSFI